MRTSASNFKNNVSAVLSSMKSQRNEADVQDGKWVITESGRRAIEHIRNSPRFAQMHPRGSAQMVRPGVIASGRTSRKEVPTTPS